ncbi:uncharacterized protein BCR38DRAFT_489600 [Pseudomassariella vexata]|uniref:Infection structure specific protein n=1 Tax=Pseudomassariella vexata TaxID=1141098 RepID=A0A1Y2DFR5_9PEZI|nr:uncharacterized protein BCR38DRAFT_489600 [Pseudomassariella vexata]ORY58120.1 hypothetical protein BCR38DRAFT_489600 [Pseudomassariella vexata]
MFTKTFITASLVATASASIPAVARRAFLATRQTDISDPVCIDVIASVLPLYNSLPTPPPSLVSATFPSDPCETPSFTGELASDYTSYSSEALEWYSSNSAEIISALSACPAITKDQTIIPICSTLTAGDNDDSSNTESGSATATDADSEGASSTGSSAASSGAVTRNVAPRETGFVAAGIAAAGFIGAIAAL